MAGPSTATTPQDHVTYHLADWARSLTFESLSEEGYLTATPEVVALNRDGLLRVDSLLPRFFLPEHAGIRYT